MQVAISKPTKATLVPLWLHEYFAVYKSKVKVRGVREVDVYQAVEFRAGQDLPLKLRNAMTGNCNAPMDKCVSTILGGHVILKLYSCTIMVYILLD
jgi:hypothetical protein